MSASQNTSKKGRLTGEKAGTEKSLKESEGGRTWRKRATEEEEESATANVASSPHLQRSSISSAEQIRSRMRM
jgi:hypothetical protein